jgi:hypothetical protein
MIVSKYFVFVHFPKSGGSFVRKVLRETAPHEWGLREHAWHKKLSTLPSELRMLPVIGYVRNPFDWYVSWYAYLREEYLRQRCTNDFFSTVSDHGARSFKETMQCILRCEMDELYADCPFPGSVFGCHFASHFGNDLANVNIGKFEDLRADLARLLITCCTTIPEELKTCIQSHEKVNTSRRGQYRSYYDKELRDIILQRDREVLQRFDYRF